MYRYIILLETLLINIQIHRELLYCDEVIHLGSSIGTWSVCDTTLLHRVETMMKD